jgi:hypothetical protein
MLGYQYTNTVELQPTEDELVAAASCLLRVPVTWGSVEAAGPCFILGSFSLFLPTSRMMLDRISHRPLDGIQHYIPVT